MNTTDTTAIQLKSIIKGGASLEEACELLGIDVDAAKMYLDTENSKSLDCDEIIRQEKPHMLRILAEIAKDITIENVSARVAAAKVFVEGKGEMPELPVDKLSELYKKMKGAVMTQEKEIGVMTKTAGTNTVTMDMDKRELVNN